MKSLSLYNEPVSQINSKQEIYQPNTSHSNSNSSLKQDASFALLNQMFPEQRREDKTIKQARIILGDMIDRYSSDELQEIISLSQYLTESWLDEWEKELFEGKTLDELLNLG